MRWVVTQIGSREHYSVPRAFHKSGHLYRFYTDIWLGRFAPWTKKLPGPFRNLENRSHEELPSSKVKAFNLHSARILGGSLLGGGTRTTKEQYDMFSLIGREFAEDVNRHLTRTQFDGKDSAAFLFCTGALETCQLMRRLGVPVVVDQLDPAQADEKMVRAEMEKWPGWQKLPGEVPRSYYDRIREEWNLADVVLVNSNWSRSALVNEGINPDKIIVVPLCYEDEQRPVNLSAARAVDRPLTVLWIGQVVLRKGIPYLFEAARKLQGTNIRFIVAGSIGISPQAIAAAPPNVSLLGRVSRADKQKYYAESDVFVLPTVSDGFALTQLEAMSFGLPVITTPNCGDVVTHGIDGLIIPVGDSQALAEAIVSLDRDRELLRQMSIAAIKKPRERQFSLSAYAEAVEATIKPIVRVSKSAVVNS